ncbi:hypothetical protein RKE38_05755 [Phycicoccus sp. M110.8]|uniref:hypothetical protein n=1 Tax=Phycicoccus sp. M110.8 TaxID=3075433 RepID=UPI0028FCFD61|nr:hypothetical protein [Phycicoccus sp. M110.8]MDU0313185.1 hypothetical protein [Phycicoccus sp. M110.8]
MRTDIGEDGLRDWLRRWWNTGLNRSLAFYWMGAIALMVVSGLLWRWTASGSFLRDYVGPTLLGSGVTAVAAFASLLVIANKEMQERRELNRLQDAPATSRPSLSLGHLSIEDIRVVAAGDELERRMRFRVLSPGGDDLPRRADPPEWFRIETDLLPRLQQRAQERRQVFFDDEKLDLLDAVRSRDLEDGRPVTVYELSVGATTYFRFAGMSNALDEDVSELFENTHTLRERWGHEPLALEHVSSLPAPAAMGCGVVVVTNDNQIVLLERASTYIGGPLPGDRRTKVHIVAEGMIPADVRAGGSPLRAAALRALDEELGIDVVESGNEPLSGLKLVGMFFDTGRWQPCFVWLARLSVSLDELATMQSVASDGWEAASLFGTPFDIRADRTRALLLNQHHTLVAATNHARACLILALIANQGLVQCRAALSWGSGRGRRRNGPGFRMSEEGPGPEMREGSDVSLGRR